MRWLQERIKRNQGSRLGFPGLSFRSTWHRRLGLSVKEFIQQESAANPLGIGGLLDFRGLGFRGEVSRFICFRIYRV